MDTTILLFLNHGKYIPLILQSGQKTAYQLGEKEHILVPYIFFSFGLHPLEEENSLGR